jgi:hypothetical protein
MAPIQPRRQVTAQNSARISISRRQQTGPCCAHLRVNLCPSMHCTSSTEKGTRPAPYATSPPTASSHGKPTNDRGRSRPEPAGSGCRFSEGANGAVGTSAFNAGPCCTAACRCRCGAGVCNPSGGRQPQFSSVRTGGLSGSLLNCWWLRGFSFLVSRIMSWLIHDRTCSMFFYIYGNSFPKCFLLLENIEFQIYHGISVLRAASLTRTSRLVSPKCEHYIIICYIFFVLKKIKVSLFREVKQS